MKNQIVSFVVDRELDIANYFTGLRSYERNMGRGFQQQKNERYEQLLSLPVVEQRTEIETYTDVFYKNVGRLESLAADINDAWVEIEDDFIKKLEEIHDGYVFPESAVRGVLSSGDRFGYNLEGKWFAVNMLKNKFIAMDIATHELMHFMFHRYYEDVCVQKGLTSNTIWDIKEAFTALLNLECGKFRFQLDNGYSPHLQLRGKIEKYWGQTHSFGKTLEAVIEEVQ